MYAMIFSMTALLYGCVKPWSVIMIALGVWMRGIVSRLQQFWPFSVVRSLRVLIRGAYCWLKWFLAARLRSRTIGLSLGGALVTTVEELGGSIMSEVFVLLIDVDGTWRNSGRGWNECRLSRFERRRGNSSPKNSNI